MSVEWEARFAMMLRVDDYTASAAGSLLGIMSRQPEGAEVYYGGSMLIGAIGAVTFFADGPVLYGLAAVAFIVFAGWQLRRTERRRRQMPH